MLSFAAHLGFLEGRFFAPPAAPLGMTTYWHLLSTAQQKSVASCTWTEDKMLNTSVVAEDARARRQAIFRTARRTWLVRQAQVVNPTWAAQIWRRIGACLIAWGQRMHAPAGLTNDATQA